MAENDVHVVPLNDILEHSNDSDCWCDPEVNIVGADLVIVHNSFDGREERETEGQWTNREKI